MLFDGLTPPRPWGEVMTDFQQMLRPRTRKVTAMVALEAARSAVRRGSASRFRSFLLQGLDLIAAHIRRGHWDAAHVEAGFFAGFPVEERDARTWRLSAEEQLAMVAGFHLNRAVPEIERAAVVQVLMVLEGEEAAAYARRKAARR